MTIRISFDCNGLRLVKTSPANAGCPLGLFNFLNVIDIDILLFKKSKINAAFLIINE